MSVILHIYPGTSTTQPIRVNFTPENRETIDQAVKRVLKSYIPRRMRGTRDTLKEMMNGDYNLAIQKPDGVTKGVDKEKIVSDYMDDYSTNTGGQTKNYRGIKIVVQEPRTGGYL